MPRVRRSWPPLAYLALSVLMTWPLARHLGDGLPGLGDALLQAWIVAWNAHALGSAPAAVWDAPIFYPYPDTLAFHDSHLLLSALTAPLTWSTGEPLLAHNLLVLLSFALSGWAVFLLVRDTLPGAGPWPAFVAGAAFAFCAYRFAHLTQLNLLQTPWMVFALLFLRRLLRPRAAGGGRLSDALLCGLFAGLQAVTALYYAYFAAALLGGYALLWAAGALWGRLRRGAPLPWRQAALLALAGGVGAAVTLPFTLPFVRVYGSLAIVRSVRELDGWSAPLRAYVSVTQSNLLYARLGERVVDAGEMVLFPGLLVALLALGGGGMILNGALRRFSRRTSGPISPLDGAFWLCVAGAAFLLSLGTGLRLVRFADPLPLPLPYLLLYTSVPGFGALRVPSRWGLLVTLALAVLAAVALAALLARLRPRWRVALGAAALAVVLAEQAAPPFGLPAGPQLTAAPPVYAWLADPARAGLGPVLELPVSAAPRGDSLDVVIARQWHGRRHWRPLVASYSGLIPFGTTDLLRRAEDLPAEQVLSALRLAGVGALVVHADELDPAAGAALLAGLDASAQAERLAEVGAAVVYRLPPDPRLAAVERAAGPGGAVYISGDERIPGALALGVVRRLAACGHSFYGPARPRFYAALAAPRPGQVFEAGLLGDAEDPRAYGFATAGLVWSGDGLALYRRDPALLASLPLAATVPGQFHPRFPHALELEPTPRGLRAGAAELELGAPTGLRVELDVAALGAGEFVVGARRVALPPGLSTVGLSLAPGEALALAGAEGSVALLRLRALAASAAPPAVTPEPGLALAADVAFEGGRLVVRARGAGAEGVLLDITGAAAFDDRPVKLLAGSQPLPPTGGEVTFAVDPLRPAAPWASAGDEPVDGRYIVYLKDAGAPASPGAPVAQFNLRGGQIADVQPVPLPLTAAP
ncbi:MAG TPA: hypothetical protein PKD53_03550 [Chloroflexaceae bacterium]|nr:hypothetical protein [Chloroflexaceae bacterium]